jgi:hypothetical protein
MVVALLGGSEKAANWTKGFLSDPPRVVEASLPAVFKGDPVPATAAVVQPQPVDYAAIGRVIGEELDRRLADRDRWLAEQLAAIQKASQPPPAPPANMVQPKPLPFVEYRLVNGQGWVKDKAGVWFWIVDPQNPEATMRRQGRVLLPLPNESAVPSTPIPPANSGFVVGPSTSSGTVAYAAPPPPPATQSWGWSQPIQWATGAMMGSYGVSAGMPMTGCRSGTCN